MELIREFYGRFFGVKITVEQVCPLHDKLTAGDITSYSWTDLFDQLWARRKNGIDEREASRISALYP